MRKWNGPGEALSTVKALSDYSLNTCISSALSPTGQYTVFIGETEMAFTNLSLVLYGKNLHEENQNEKPCHDEIPRDLLVAMEYSEDGSVRMGSGHCSPFCGNIAACIFTNATYAQSWVNQYSYTCHCPVDLCRDVALVTVGTSASIC